MIMSGAKAASCRMIVGSDGIACRVAGDGELHERVTCKSAAVLLRGTQHDQSVLRSRSPAALLACSTPAARCRFPVRCRGGRAYRSQEIRRRLWGIDGFLD